MAVSLTGASSCAKHSGVRQSVALVRAHLASSGAAALRRGLPVYAGLFAAAGMLFGGNGLQATTVVAGAADSWPTAMLLWGAWLLLVAPAIDALWRTPASFWLRSLPVARGWHLAISWALTIVAEAPWWWLWSEGGGVVVGVAALGGALLGHALLLARPPGIVGWAWVLVMPALVWVPAPYLAFGTWPIALVGFRRAWLLAPTRAGARPRAWIAGPRVVALALALSVSLWRGFAAVLLRCVLLFALAAGAAWLAARSNAQGMFVDRLYYACGFMAPVALAAGSALAGPMLATEGRALWLLRAGLGTARTRLAAMMLAVSGVGGSLAVLTGGALVWAWGLVVGEVPMLLGSLVLVGAALAGGAGLAARWAATQGTRGPGRLIAVLLLVCVVVLAVQARVGAWAPVVWAAAAMATWLIGHVMVGRKDVMGGASVLLEMCEIRKRLGSRVILEEVTLRCAAGEQVLVLGENGAGKSTLLRIAAGIIEPDRGTVRVGGAALVGRGGVVARAALGYAPDTADAFPELSVRELIALVTAMKRTQPPTEALRERLGLGLVWHQRLRTLSFGQVKRAYLLAALTGEPPLLILDEPSNGLDPEGVVMLAALLRERGAAGCGAVVASNDAAFAALLGGTRRRIAAAHLVDDG